MTAYTPVYGIPYQTINDAPHGPDLGEKAFLKVDAALAGVDGRVATLETAAALNARLRTVKTAGQALNASSTVLQNVTGLSLPVVAGTYAWELRMPYECTNNTPDMKVAFTFPTTSSASYAYQALALAVTGSPPYLMDEAGGSLVSGTAFVLTGTVGLRASIFAYGHFIFTAAGTVQVQAAQNTSDVNVVTVHPGAQLILDRTA